jgi:hypothetical protein
MVSTLLLLVTITLIYVTYFLLLSFLSVKRLTSDFKLLSFQLGHRKWMSVSLSLTLYTRMLCWTLYLILVQKYIFIIISFLYIVLSSFIIYSIWFQSSMLFPLTALVKLGDICPRGKVSQIHCYCMVIIGYPRYILHIYRIYTMGYRQCYVLNFF